jgi:hypothetical protein
MGFTTVSEEEFPMFLRTAITMRYGYLPFRVERELADESLVGLLRRCCKLIWWYFGQYPYFLSGYHEA